MAPPPGSRTVRIAHTVRARHVKLVYGADRSTARPGDTVIFTAWISNGSKSHLRNIRLIPRSFTNEAMEPLAYASSPAHEDLAIQSLAPGESVMRSFSYRVTEVDHSHGGSLVSAMQVRASRLGRQVTDEHDAIVSLSGARTPWPVRSTRPGLGHWSSTPVTSVKPRRRPRRLAGARKLSR
ncbi:hypothetical protein [Paenarthrobacter sp. NPDC058040]|uniref:hypothetical protein n=1 Tax=unclassified Paenarthrobacter TaxID=2634190 RepID=UPI0036D91CCE